MLGLPAQITRSHLLKQTLFLKSLVAINGSMHTTESSTSHYLLGYNAMYSGESKPNFRRNNIWPTSLTLLVTCFMLFSCLVYSLKAICSSQTDFQWTTRRYIPEATTLYNYRCENLKSYNILFIRNLPTTVSESAKERTRVVRAKSAFCSTHPGTNWIWDCSTRNKL
jgi:hypothetical protein